MSKIKQSVHWPLVSLCPNGHVLLGFGYTTVHLSLQEMREFMKSAQAFLETFEKNPGWLQENPLGYTLNH